MRLKATETSATSTNSTRRRSRQPARSRRPQRGRAARRRLRGGAARRRGRRSALLESSYADPMNYELDEMVPIHVRERRRVSLAHSHHQYMCTLWRTVYFTHSLEIQKWC